MEAAGEVLSCCRWAVCESMDTLGSLLLEILQ